MKNNIDGSDINVGSIDEDIKTLEELINNCEECKFATCEQCEINWRKVQAIKNVLNEVKDYQNHKKYHCEQLEKVLSEIESFKNRENKELETWKKIAEKLADILSDKILETLGIKPRIEDLIENARKEVENGNNSSSSN